MSLHDDVRQSLMDIMPEPWVAKLQDDDDLFELMDSIDVVRLVDQLQGHYGISVSNAEMTAENLGSLAAIAGLIERKTSSATR